MTYRSLHLFPILTGRTDEVVLMVDGQVMPAVRVQLVVRPPAVGDDG